MKFKVGDIVRFKESYSNVTGRKYTNLHNQIGKVTYVSNNNRVHWIIAGDSHGWDSNINQLELAKEQVVKSIINDILAN